MDASLLLASLFFALLAASCSAPKRVENARAQLEEQYRALPDYEALPVRALTWRQAHAMLLEHNAEYAQAQLALAEARRQEQAVYRNLIPSIHFGYYYSRALFHNQGGWGDNGGQMDVNVIFNLPDLLSLPVEKYTRSLATYKAEQDCRQKQRELEAKLYLLFLEEAREHKASDSADAAWEPQEAAREKRRQAQDQRQRERWGKVCALLGNYQARWRLAADSLPPADVGDYREKVSAPGELTQVAMALELEASRLRKMGVALRYWPSTQVNFYSPSLFNMSGGNMGGFMEGVEDVRINLNLYQELDTRLEGWQEYQSSKEAHRLLQEQLALKMYEWREKMRLVMESWSEYREWRQAVESYMAFRRSQGEQSPADMLRLHQEMIKLDQELRDQETKNAERIGALIQEYGLPPSPPSSGSWH